jgi:phosphopantetheinyl transferase (holo-ACP synthase)
MSTATTEIILSIEARGEIVSSNFPAFAEMVRARLGEINRDLATDEDFDQADADAKAIAGAEAALKEAKAKALADAEQLHALFEGIDGLTAELAAARLDLAGQIRKRKEEVKAEIIEESLAGFDIDPRDARRHFLAGLQNAIKGKKNLDSMRSACRIYQATQQAMILQCRGILDTFEKAHGADLIMDRRELELEKPEGLEAELRRRFEAKRAREEKARLEAEMAAVKAEAAKAIAEANKPTSPVTSPANVERGPWGHSAPLGALDGASAVVTDQEPPVVTADEEWADFKTSCIAAFQAIKAKREKLMHSKNIAKATGLANGFNATWKEWA